jgi:uncharacterized protein YhfF
MQINANVCAAYWNDYLESLPPESPHHQVRPNAFAFGDSELLANNLAVLVLEGKKQATTSLAVEFTALSELLPKVGDVSIILSGSGAPVAIIELYEVQHLPFDAVDEEFVSLEGEGDGSLAYWRAAHTEYFNGVCKRLGGRFDETTPVICQSFRLLWRGGSS